MRSRSLPQLYGASWVRTRYSIEDDHFAPAPSHEPEVYDPFAVRVGRADRIRHYAVYLDAVNVETDDPGAVLAFVNRWGLLGLFQHDMPSLRYVAFDDGWSDPGVIRSDQARDVVEEDAFRRRVWLHRFDPHDMDDRVRADEWYRDAHGLDEHDDIDGDLALDDALDSTSGEWERTFDAIHEDRLTHVDYCAEWFPRIAPASSFPPIHPPVYDNFHVENRGVADVSPVWSELHEPTWATCHALREFQHAHLWIAERKTPSIEGMDWDEQWAAERRVNEHFAKCRSVLVEGDSGFEHRWNYPSLLAALYAMLLDYAVSDSVKVKVCVDCGKSFTPDRSDQRYCRETCRNRSKKGRARSASGWEGRRKAQRDQA